MLNVQDLIVMMHGLALLCLPLVMLTSMAIRVSWSVYIFFLVILYVDSLLFLEVDRPFRSFQDAEWFQDAELPMSTMSRPTGFV